jgi:hypothetical protein
MGTGERMPKFLTLKVGFAKMWLACSPRALSVHMNNRKVYRSLPEVVERADGHHWWRCLPKRLGTDRCGLLCIVILSNSEERGNYFSVNGDRCLSLRLAEPP